MDLRNSLDAVFALAEVSSVTERLVSDACEAAWCSRYTALAEALILARSTVAALETAREAERAARAQEALFAEELKVKLELELWEVSRQLQERKRWVLLPPRARALLVCMSLSYPQR
jgi:hypothetical protein